MAHYRVAEPVHIETIHETHGPIELEFQAGDITPRSEQEEAALVHLASLGFAEVIDDEPVDKKAKPPKDVTDAPE